MPSFLKNVLALPPRTKGVLAVSGVAILAICFLLLKMATAPSFALMSSGLDPAQTGKITAALDAQGIAYELRSNGTALAVQSSQMPQARIALATAGVSVSGAGAQPGYAALMDKTKLGTSQFQQQITAQRALEGEVAAMVNNVEGVTGAVVQLVLPEDTLFADSQSPATASVMLGNTADTLQPGAVRGIAQMTASAVKGLKSENVTITDGAGQLLWPSGDGGDPSGGAGATKQSAEARYDRTLESSLNAMLAATLGPNKARVTVNADLNVDKTSQQALTYAKKGVPLTTSSTTEKLKGGSASAGGAAGTSTNIPTYSTGSANGNANSNYQSAKKDTTWGVDKTVTKTDVASGAINRLNVALIVDKSVPGPVVTQLKSTLAAAAGLNPKRGDPPIAATQMAFAKVAPLKTGPVPTTLLAPLKWVGLGLASLLFLFFMSRSLRKRESESLGTPAWLKEIEEPISLAQLEQSTADPFGAPLPPRATDASLHHLDQLMEREPERVAAQVKQWMAAD
jgi:flagellar M-ring protein FliF